MGSYDPIVIAVSLAVSLLALGAVYIVAWTTRREEERAAVVVGPEPVLTEDEHFEQWIQQVWPGASYAQRVAERTWLNHPGARP